MTIGQLKQELKGQYAGTEVYRFRDNLHIISSEYITAINDETDHDEVCEYKLMDENEYNHTVYANSSYTADFEGYYDNKDAKVLIIVLKESR